MIYDKKAWEGVTFSEELERLSEEIDLKVVHVLEDPPDEWEGETGFIDEELLEKYLPEEPYSRTYYICGPGPMMDIAESSLHNLGVRWNHIRSEEHTSELQSRGHLVCRLLLEKKIGAVGRLM